MRLVSSDTSRSRRGWAGWGRLALAATFVVTLLTLGAANIALRASWNEVEDGVLWKAGPQGVTAAEIAARTPAARAGIRPGDVLLAIDDQPIEKPSDVLAVLHAAAPNQEARYTLLRLDRSEVVEVALAPLARGNTALYYVLAAVGIFTLIVGAAVRLRRPSDQATLHFFWLCLAFFGTFTFSFNGRLDRLDWVFYWADAIAILLLPPLFLHFTLVFPDRPRAWMHSAAGRATLPLLYVPAFLLGLARVIAVARMQIDPAFFGGVIAVIDRVEPLYLAACFGGGLYVLWRARADVRSVTAGRQLRWIGWGTALGALPFAFGYALPYALGLGTSLPMELTAVPLSLIPLAFASAIVRYRLMDVEVIVKRALVYAAALAAILGIYTLLLGLASNAVFDSTSSQHNTVIALLATLVVVLLASPVKNAIQAALDRAFYRDRYDYRRALVGFARDLNSDLDLSRLSERLVSRVMETLLTDRMALLLADEASGDFEPIRAAGFSVPPPGLSRRSGLGGRLEAGHTVALDDPLSARRFTDEEIEFWRDWGLYYFVPCVSKEGTIAVLALGRRESAEPLSSEDMALLAAVAGQVATALENGRLYRQLRMKAEELDRLREFNENILESLDDGLLVLDLEDRIVRWNRALEQLYGVPRAQAVGQPLDAVFDRGFVEAICAARRDNPNGATLYRMPLSPRDRAERRLLVNATTVPLVTHVGPDIRTTGTVIIIEDISARVQLEEQLQVSDKMASIGLLAAGVAHEVNTPLTGISSFTQMLLEGADPDDPRTRLLEKIERQTFRAAKIVNGLLNLSRQGAQANERVPVDVHAVINDVLVLLEHQLELGNIKVRRDLDSGAAVIVGTEHKLQQVFLNLFLNARDAMPKGGWLSVVSRIEGDRLRLEIADTGSGIPAEHLSRIYDPFFTTKSLGHGTGLGLSITYGIVREHEGTIDVQSTVGQGTTFALSFPLAPAYAQRTRAAT
ncbi:MAG TPA: ATP-binding protein [Vicinamibacterales bacterium]|nr:ATP-binding protein [Vicinamibacterales bacterium]